MRETFRTDKKKGDPLYHQEVNDLGRAARAFASESGEGFHGFFRASPVARRQSRVGKLVELCAQETAQRNVPYTCLKGKWNADLGLYCYDDAATVYAIDHRAGSSYAETGWKGLYQAMPSTVPAHNGTLYVLVTLDCELPPEGCTCSGGT